VEQLLQERGVMHRSHILDHLTAQKLMGHEKRPIASLAAYLSDWWGKLVIELIYDTLDPDVAKWLKENKPPAGLKWHQQLTENLGARKLVSRCYEIIGMSKTCSTIKELRDRVALHYGKEPVQLTLYLPKNKEAAN
jgi:P63C domain